MAPKAKVSTTPLPDVWDEIEGNVESSLDDLVRVHLAMLSEEDRDFFRKLILEEACDYLMSVHHQELISFVPHLNRRKARVQRFLADFCKMRENAYKIIHSLTSDSSVAPFMTPKVNDKAAGGQLVKLIVAHQAFDEAVVDFYKFIAAPLEASVKNTASRDAAVQKLYENCKLRWGNLHPTNKKDKCFNVVKVFLLASTRRDDCPYSEVRQAVVSAGVV